MSGLAKPDNKIHIEATGALNSDIMAAMEKRFAQAVQEAAPIAKKFKRSTRLETARNIWEWLKNDITYKKDPEGYQDIRMPRYFHHHKMGDCKSYTLNSLAIYHNIYPQDKVRFFYAGYAPGADTPSHVYGKIQPSDGSKEIIIDGCWYFANSEKDYTFGKYSPDMTVRTLSDNLVNVPSARVTRGMDIERMYKALPAYDRGRFENCISDLVQLKLMELGKKQGALNKEEIESVLSGISAKHKKKGGKGGGKKVLHWFNAAALFIGRSAFLLFVTLNVNGLASKLAQLNKWGKLGGVLNTWYMMGGNNKKFLKIIAKGATKKKLFLSKKAKNTYEQRYGALSPNEVAYEKGVHGTDFTIGVLPAVAAAALAVVPILAGIIPKMIQGFRAAGPQGHREAAGLINEGHAMANTVAENGYPYSPDAVAPFMAPGDSFHGPGVKGGVPGAKPGVKFVFDWHNLHVISGIYGIYDDGTDSPAPVSATTGQENPNPQPEPVAPVNDKFADTMKTLGPILNTVTTAGLATAGSVMSQSANPNIRKWGNALDGAESALTANALAKAGYHQEAQFHQGAARRINLFPIAAGVGTAWTAFEIYKYITKPKAA